MSPGNVRDIAKEYSWSVFIWYWLTSHNEVLLSLLYARIYIYRPYPICKPTSLLRATVISRLCVGGLVLTKQGFKNHKR